jgi:Mrp family chromosome partitioning ATPase
MPLELAMRLFRQRQREVELLSSYTEDSIPVKSIRNQIIETQRILDEIKTGTVPAPTNRAIQRDEPLAAPLPNPWNEDLAMIASLQAKMTVHKARLKQTLDEAQRIDAVEAKIVDLQRKKDLQEVNYRYLSQSLERARIDNALTSGKISNISVVQPATLPTQPMKEDLVKRMGLALLLGVALGLGLAMAKEYVFDHTIRSAEELRARLHFPLLVSVPEVRPDSRSLRRPRKPLALPAHEDAPGGEAEAWGVHQDLHAYCETLRDRLRMTLGDSTKPPYVIGITSCVRRAGVSTIATGLALELSRSGDRPVLLISGGGNTSLPKIFGVNAFAGITDVVAHPDGKTALVQRNLYFVPAENAGKDWEGATPDQRFAEMIPFVRNGNSRFVIVDLPPVDETSLALRVGRLLDGVVLVIPSEKVNRHAALHAVDELERSGVKILGTILNQRRQYIPEWFYRRR